MFSLWIVHCFYRASKKIAPPFTDTYIQYGRSSKSFFLRWGFLVVVDNSTRTPVTKIVDREMSLADQTWLHDFWDHVTHKTCRYILLVVFMYKNHDTGKSPNPGSWRMRASRYLRSKRLSFTRKVGFIFVKLRNAFNVYVSPKYTLETGLDVFFLNMYYVYTRPSNSVEYSLIRFFNSSYSYRSLHFYIEFILFDSRNE